MRMKRICFLGLALVFLWSSLLLNLSAEDSPTEGTQIGISLEDFTSENATLFTDGNGDLKISFSRVSPTLSVSLSPGALSAEHNAVRLVLTNNSACNSLHFTYRYTDEVGQEQTKTEKITLAARGVSNDYYVYVEAPDRITEISLGFSGISTGTIVLKSIEGASLYRAEADSFAVLTSFAYDRADGSIVIRGSIKYEFLTKYRNARLVLYALEMDADRIPYGMIPVAAIPMSSRFDFTLEDVSLEDRMKAYAVAIVDEGGAVLSSLAPRVPATKAEALSHSVFFKGVHSDFGVAAARANAKLAVIDVDLERLVSDKTGDGQLYALSGRSFYFDRQYVSFLDDEIRTSYKNGMQVYLRLISSKNSEHGLSGVVATTSEERFCLYAYADFLCNRYSSSSRGVVSGLIYGTAADETRLLGMSVKEYTRLYADSLFVLCEVADSFDREIEVTVPISDFFEKNADELSPRIFLVSLGNALQQRYFNLPRIGLLVESRVLSGEGDKKQNLGFENLADFSAFLERLSDTYPTISEKYLYYWNPTDLSNRDLLKASLLHGYYALACEDNAYGFVFSTDSIHDLSLAEEVMNVFQLADTRRGEKNSVLALGTLRVEDWPELIEGYSKEKIPETEHRETTDVITPPFRFFGDCYLWDFSQMGNNYGWVAGNGCKSLAMEKNEETNRALAIKMLPLAENNYASELIYRFDETRDFSAVDALSFVFRIDAPTGKYRVTVQMCSDTSMAEATFLLETDKLSEIYLNTSGMFEGETVRCIRIFTVPASGQLGEYKLSIGSISAHSTTLRAGQLEASVKPVQDYYVQNETGQAPAPIWIYVMVLLGFVSVIVIVGLHVKGEEDT